MEKIPLLQKLKKLNKQKHCIYEIPIVSLNPEKNFFCIMNKTSANSRCINKSYYSLLDCSKNKIFYDEKESKILL